jgi:hypothetical protein
MPLARKYLEVWYCVRVLDPDPDAVFCLFRIQIEIQIQVLKQNFNKFRFTVKTEIQIFFYGQKFLQSANYVKRRAFP